jgi:hypothetical protein
MGSVVPIRFLADADALGRERAVAKHPASLEGDARGRWIPLVASFPNKATDEELNELIAQAELAGVGKGSLEAVILGVYNFATNSGTKPIDKLTSKQAKDLTAFLAKKAAEMERRVSG